MAGVLTFASSLNFASTPAPASTCIFDDAAVAAGIRSEIRSEIYDGVIINPAAEQREPDAAAEAGSEVTNLRMHAPKKKARVAPSQEGPRNLARSPNSHYGGRAYGAQQRAGDVPRRMVSHNHLAIGLPRRAVAREDRKHVVPEFGPARRSPESDLHIMSSQPGIECWETH